ncbi:unnamed protein product, partial [Didymodactylos carnosus]
EQLTEEQSRSTSLEEKIENLEKDYLLRENNFKTTISNQQLDIDRIIERKERLTDQLWSLKEALLEINTLYDKVENPANESIKQDQEIEREEEADEKIMNDFKRQVETVKENQNSVQNKIGLLKSQYDNDIRMLKNQLVLIEQEEVKKDDYDILQRNLTNKNNEIESLKNQEKEYKLEIDELKVQLNMNSEEIKRYHTIVETLENKRNVKEKNILELTEHIETYKNDINTLKLTIDNKNKEIDQLRQDLLDKSDQTDKLQSEIEILKHREMVLDNDNSEKEKLLVVHKQTADELTKKTNYIQQYENIIGDLRSEQTKLQNESQQTKTKNEQLSMELERVTKENEYFSDVQTKNDVLENEIKQLRTDNKQLFEEYEELKQQLNTTLADKIRVENELDRIQRQLETSETVLNTNREEDEMKLKQTLEFNGQDVEDLQHQLNTSGSEIETKSKLIDEYEHEIMTLKAKNEQHESRIHELENQQTEFENDKNEIERQLFQKDEKKSELELTLQQQQESAAKLRKVLHKMKESMTTNDQVQTKEMENNLKKLSNEYEEKLLEQEQEYNAKLKAVTKEMNNQIEEKERIYNQQLNEFIEKSYRNENNLKDDSEKRINDSDKRALVAEQEVQKLHDTLQERQLEYHNALAELESKIVELTQKQEELILAAAESKSITNSDEHQKNIHELSNIEKSSNDQSTPYKEDSFDRHVLTSAQFDQHSVSSRLSSNVKNASDSRWSGAKTSPVRYGSNDSLHSFMFEATEVDYLKQIVLAYMTGTDPVTMAKVICAVLRYTDDEKQLILEHEKVRQSHWFSSTR